MSANVDQVAAAVAKVAAELGAPTVLVSNGGITRDNLLFKMTEQDWDAVLAVHLRGAFLMSPAVQRQMIEARWCRRSPTCPVPPAGQPGPGQLRGGQGRAAGFTKTLAIELSKFGVRVNAVAPGFVVTDMTRATAQRAED